MPPYPILAIPTDTCYGLACPLSDEAGYRQIYRLKGRDFKKPLAFVVRTFDDLAGFVEISSGQLAFLRRYPYPFTLLADPKPNAPIPDFLDRGQYALIALRVGERCVPETVANGLPFPMFLTSANRSGERECRTGEECRMIFGSDVSVLGSETCDRPASDIFAFDGADERVRYVRRNYG